MTKPGVKICCISSIEETEIAVEHGAAALGLVGHMPGRPGVIGDEVIYQIVKAVPPPSQLSCLPVKQSRTTLYAIINVCS